MFESQLYTETLIRLLSSVIAMLKEVTATPTNYPDDFLSEWAELHASAIYTTLLPYFVKTASEYFSFGHLLSLVVDMFCMWDVVCLT